LIAPFFAGSPVSGIGWDMADWWVYIIDKHGHFYTGITTDLRKRLRQHGVSNTLYVERHSTKTSAVKRERGIKGWSRRKKAALSNRPYPQ